MKQTIISRMMQQPTVVSMEDVETAEPKQEIEYIFFFKLSDPGQLLSAPMIVKQEQFELQLPQLVGNDCKAFQRVRKETRKGEQSSTFTSTIKVARSGVLGRQELTREVDEEFFELYKSLCPSGMVKTRVSVPIDGTEGQGPGNVFGDDRLVWEIDVFGDPTGSEHAVEPWVKVDLEVKAALPTMPQFPFSYEKSIINQYNDRTPDEAEFIKQLFDQVCVRPAAAAAAANAEQAPAQAPAADDGADAAPATEPNAE